LRIKKIRSDNGT
jgi:hypothetical protein